MKVKVAIILILIFTALSFLFSGCNNKSKISELENKVSELEAGISSLNPDKTENNQERSTQSKNSNENTSQTSEYDKDNNQSENQETVIYFTGKKQLSTKPLFHYGNNQVLQ